MSSWLGKGIREEAAAIGEAYAKMQKGGYINPGVKSKPSSDPDSNLNKGKDHPKGEAQKLNNSYEEDSYESELHETSKQKMFQALIQRSKSDAKDGEKKKTASGKEKSKETMRRIREKNAKEYLQRAKREDYDALGDAYASIYLTNEDLLDEGNMPRVQSNSNAAPMPKPKNLGKSKPAAPMRRAIDRIPTSPQPEGPYRNEDGLIGEEAELLATLQDAYAMMYEKKKDSDKCGDDTYWDKEEKKCKSKKKSGGGGSRIYFGGGYHHGHSGGGGTDNGGDTDTDGGSDGGGDGGGGGGE